MINDFQNLFSAEGGSDIPNMEAEAALDNLPTMEETNEEETEENPEIPSLKDNEQTEEKVQETSENEEENTGQSWLMFYVIKNKAENVKKALLHLQELTYKKDPFD